MSKRVVVTGADGFVGAPTCKALADEGYQVRAIVRREPCGVAPVADTIAMGNLHAATDWKSALSEVDVVVHLAGRAHVLHERAEEAEDRYREANVGITEGLLRAADVAGVSRFIFVSSIKVNGEETTNIPFKPSDQPAPLDAYGRSKLAAEERVRSFGSKTMDWVILRPPLMYGEGVVGNFARLAKIAKTGLPLPLGAIHNRRDLLAVKNFAGLIACVAGHERAANQIFLARDGEAISTTQLIRELANSASRKARLLPVPASVLKPLGDLLGRGAEVRRLLGNLEIDDSLTREKLGWQPRATRSDVFRMLMSD